MSSRDQKHLLLITISGYGHVVPMIALAKRLLQYHNITLAMPAFSLEHVKRKGEFPPEFEQQVNIVGIDNGVPLGVSEDEGLIQEWFNQFTDGAPRLEQFLLQMPAATPPPSGEPGKRKKLDSQIGQVSVPVDMVIGDIFLTKAMRVLAQRNIPYYLFICSALGPFENLLYVTGSTPVAEMDKILPFWTLRPGSEGPQPAIDEQTKELALSINTSLREARGFVVNSFRGFETRIEEIMSDLRMQHKKYHFVGPLMPEEKDGSTEKQHVLEENTKAWLDGRPDRSVIYVSFGGYSVEDESRIIKVGNALLKLGKPFIFALREHQHKLLPEELQAKKNGPDSMGLVLHWAPQKVILAHPAVGVFLSHCGWNSTMESIFNGKPVVGWPCFGDQLDNALWIQEAGMGRSLVQRADGNAVGHCPQVGAEAVVEALNEALDEQCVTKATEWQRKTKAAVSPGGSSYEELHQLVKFI